MTVERTEITKTTTARKAPAKKSTIPASAKRPDDHRTARSEAGEESEITFEWAEDTYTFHPRVFNDFEVVEFLQDELIAPALRKILGVAQWEEFKNNVRDEYGIVPVDEVKEFLKELMAVAGQKN